MAFIASNNFIFPHHNDPDSHTNPVCLKSKALHSMLFFHLFSLRWGTKQIKGGIIYLNGNEIS